ncbi:MAG: ATP-binding cassette domain-containing protein [Oscillospiraceae bacterium]|nr:ATP-binding cassette domain-containing protein [Oscillospiraceae bacterium]
MYKLINISKSFDGKRVLANITAELPDKGIVTVSGPSGSGKTTLMNIISGLMKPDSGSLIGFDGKRITYIFQDARLFPWLNVYDNIMLGIQPEQKSFSVKAADGLLTRLGIYESKKLYPDELSGGMARRVSCARAILFGGDILLADEPFAGLDLDSAKVVMNELQSFSKSSLVIIVSHIDILRQFSVNINFNLQITN